MRVTRIDAGNGIVGPMGMPGYVRSYQPIWSGGGLAYTGRPEVGYYAKIGQLVHFTIQVSCSTVTNFGDVNNPSGQYHLTLPFPPATDYVFRDGGIHHTQQSEHFAMMADAEEGETDISLWYTGSNGMDQPFDGNSPHALITTDYFYVSGLYIRE